MYSNLDRDFIDVNGNELVDYRLELFGLRHVLELCGGYEVELGLATTLRRSAGSVSRTAASTSVRDCREECSVYIQFIAL